VSGCRSCLRPAREREHLASQIVWRKNGGIDDEVGEPADFLEQPHLLGDCLLETEVAERVRAAGH